MTQVLDKFYLQSVIMNKNNHICEQIYQSIYDDIFNAAVNGKTSYTYDLILNQVPKDRVFPEFNVPFTHMHGLTTSRSNTASNVPYIKLPLQISNDELVSGLQAKFPSCKISFVGDANAVIPTPEDHTALYDITQQYRQGTYVPKRGIKIDWS